MIIDHHMQQAPNVHKFTQNTILIIIHSLVQLTKKGEKKLNSTRAQGTRTLIYFLFLHTNANAHTHTPEMVVTTIKKQQNF